MVPKATRKNYLLAVSGGVDSLVMAEFFRISGYSFSIAHCNFGLRGKESDGDEAFVKAWAAKHKIPCYTNRFDTKKHAARKKLSIQMAARELRYGWFNKLREQHGFDYICIAHNSDDVIETFFINLLRGTGIAGLHGITAQHQHILRPLLIFSRNEIETYAREIDLKWREDSSNASDKYERNKIRHHLIPLLEEINPQSRKAINHTIENLREVENVYLQIIRKKLDELSHVSRGKTYLSLARLKKSGGPALYIYEAVKKYGFNYAQAKEMEAAIEKQSGRHFLAGMHRVTRDRNHFIIEVVPSYTKETSLKVTQKTKVLNAGNFDIDFSAENKPKGFKPPATPLTACLDYSLLTFPLTIRKWQKGDKFYPLGMSKPKKVSDFLIDHKIPVPEKDATHVLVSGHEIAWLIGHRIDERYKVTEATKKLYICNIEYVASL